ncbi:MAG: class I SAM-dependent methyltransferase [Betaproteobacteria bacterium]
MIETECAVDAGDIPDTVRAANHRVLQEQSILAACRICKGRTQFCFTNRLLAKYDVSYHVCDRCGFLQTERPYWLDEAYADAIAAEDVDLVGRNLRMMRILTCVLPVLFDRDARVLDLAGGYGLLTRLMRNNGLAFSWSDKFCANLFAKEFAWKDGDGPIAAVTAFEVLEHLEDPLEFIRDALNISSTRTLIFTTQLYERVPPQPGKWNYYAADAGQHIAFYQPRTLAYIARLLSVNFYSSNGIHFLTGCKLRPTLLWMLSGKLSYIFYFASRLALELKIATPKLLRA